MSVTKELPVLQPGTKRSKDCELSAWRLTVSQIIDIEKVVENEKVLDNKSNVGRYR